MLLDQNSNMRRPFDKGFTKKKRVKFKLLSSEPIDGAHRLSAPFPQYEGVEEPGHDL